jgi:hypothetical protein
MNSKSGTDLSRRSGVRLCRAIHCGQTVLGREDEFCPRCREEIDALRAMARRRLVKTFDRLKGPRLWRSAGL